MTKMLIANAAILCLLILLPVVDSGQKALLNANEIDQKFSQVWKLSEVSRKNYVWKERTEVVRDDKTVQDLIEEISIEANGKQIRKTISNQEASLPTGLLIRRIAEDQKSKIVDFMRDLRSFLERYSLADDSTRHSFFSKANLSAPDARGQLVVSGSDVFTKGDKLKWWIDPRSYTITYATISTTYKGVGAEFSGMYYLLPELNYMAQSTIRVPSKNMVITLKFYDFLKR